MGLFGEQGNDKANKAIGTQFKQHASQNHRTGRWSLGVGIGQPGMKGPNGHFDGKSNHKCPKSDGLHQPRVDTCVCQRSRIGRANPNLHQIQQVKRTHGNAHHLNGEEQPQATGHGVDEEFEGSVVTILPTPNFDEEVHWHQPKLPKDEEDHQVEGGKQAEHGGFHHQKQAHVHPHLVVNVEGGQNGNGGENGGEQEHGEANAVNTHMVAGTNGREPLGLHLEGKPTSKAVLRVVGEPHDEY